MLNYTIHNKSSFVFKIVQLLIGEEPTQIDQPDGSLFSAHGIKSITVI